MDKVMNVAEAEGQEQPEGGTRKGPAQGHRTCEERRQQQVRANVFCLWKNLDMSPKIVSIMLKE